MATNDEIIDRPVRKTVRAMYAMESENGCSCEKSFENYELMDKEARKVFLNGPSAVALKCSSVSNTHGKGITKSTNWWKIILDLDAVS